MLVLLPPSETKRDGGDGPALTLDGLSFPRLGAPRTAALASTVELAGDAQAMMRALKLGPRQVGEVERNRRLRESPSMSTIDRYTGVLYDALDSATLDDHARAYAARHVVVHSALFGLLGAGDRIPAYRLSHDSRLPGLRLRRLWREELVVEGEGAIVGVIDEAELYRGMLRDAAAPQGDAEPERPAAAQA